MLLSESVDGEAGTEFRLEPRGLRRHDVAGVGDVDELLHRDMVEGEGDLHLTAVNPAAQLAKASDTTNEINPLVRAQILDSKHFVKYEVREDGHVKNSDRILVVVPARKGLQRVPLAVQIHREVVQVVRVVDLHAHLTDREVLLKSGDELFFGKAV